MRTPELVELCSEFIMGEIMAIEFV
ncbi:hypothetical protein F383_13734 [Gossypium arboreum]|uniref:Uncharacterized protein n=1 Tax=Gossypium arboreum TaxID=29729 RepID=A0A0B0PSC8_GOSAR|nr:hypothetical protein F383_13734 [Gossypium arboreum]